MRVIVAVFLGVLLARSAGAEKPRLLVEQPGFGLELVASEPDIVTPIGMTFDAKGRLLVIESHTHQRPEDYDGPAGDRIRMFADTDRDGRLDRWSTFAEGFQQATNLCVRPDGGVYVVTRRDVRLLEDTDGDGKADKVTEILRLETDVDYPHNGLSGIVLAETGGDDFLFIGLGENFGGAYRLVGSDGTTIADSGGSGTIFICRADGSYLRRFSMGFWNPFSLCIANDQLFCVDNDPDASPPCRLINCVAGGDYGHLWQYGRAGVHPLQAWNGELPGTLPMVCGTGEAPTAIVSHHGYLWVTSWGDHRLERYELTRGAGGDFEALRTTIVQGDEDFRPTGLAVGPDGHLYFGDWVSRSYPVHGQGRIWRLKTSSASQASIPPSPQPFALYDADVAMQHRLLSAPIAAYFESHQGQEIDPEKIADIAGLGWLQFTRWKLRGPDASGYKGHAEGGPWELNWLRDALAYANPDVRLYAVRWIADDDIKELRDDVAKLLEGPMPSERYFLCVLAALEWLDGDGAPRDRGISDALLVRELANESRSPALHALAVRLISPDHEWLTAERLRGYLAAESAALKLEAVRTLAMQTRPERLAMLAEIAGDSKFDGEIRAEAVAGLAAAAAAGEYGELLTKLADGDEATVAAEAERVVALSRERRGEGDAGRPAAGELAAWNVLLAEGGDAESGRRLFFTRPGPLCSQCHQYGGRGGRVGPDLTRIGEQQSRERIIASIIRPSQEIAPHYQAWTLMTTDGLTRQGLRLPEGGDDGTEPYADPDGNLFELRSDQIELRSPSEASIMPEGLVDRLSVEDLRDLVAFLSARGD